MRAEGELRKFGLCRVRKGTGGQVDVILNKELTADVGSVKLLVAAIRGT